MGTISSELRLDLKLSAIRTIGGFLNEASTIDDGKARVAKLEECVKILEEEKGKIEAFKRELPLCFLIVSDVIGGFKEEVEQCRADDRCASAVELMPMKTNKIKEGGGKIGTDCKEKINWMSSVQLWTDNYSDEDRIDTNKTSHEEKETQCLKRKNRTEGEAFIPFEGAVVARMEEKTSRPLPELSLLSPAIENSSRVTALSEDHSVNNSRSSKSVKEASLPSQGSAGLGLQVVHQPPRKVRRCWSPELHKRFISALQHLGGAQATPKQIRELMKVEGLTNDEVKSHLQKYRLHTRRASNYSEKVNQPAVVLSRLWLPQDHYVAASSQKSASSSMSPQSPLQLACASRAISGTTGDSYDGDDGKSESHSWKQDM